MTEKKRVGRARKQYDETNDPVPPRKPLEAMRPSLREDQRDNLRDIDPLTAAKRRADEIMEHLATFNPNDKLAAPRAPNGWTYEWKRESIYNQADPTYQRELEQSGWEAVPVARHPEMMNKDTREVAIRRNGMILMERPTAIVERARNQTDQAATQQMHAREGGLRETPQGNLPRKVLKVAHEWSAIDIPKE